MIKKNTLDKGKKLPELVAASATAKAMADDNYSQGSYMATANKKDANERSEIDECVEETSNSRDMESPEYSQNVEIMSNRSSEIKYIFGEKIDPKAIERRQTNPKIRTVEQKEDSIENRFVKIYNRQGHYSTSQSVEEVYGRALCYLAKMIQCIFCCQCVGCFRMRSGIDPKRVLINLTKVIALLIIALTCAFIVFSLNEQLAF